MQPVTPDQVVPGAKFDWRTLRKNKLVVVAMVVFTVILFSALFAAFTTAGCAWPSINAPHEHT